MDIDEIAGDYIRGWDTWDAISETARLGLAEEDRYLLRQVYAEEDAGRIGAEIVRQCRARVREDMEGRGMP